MAIIIKKLIGTTTMVTNPHGANATIEITIILLKLKKNWICENQHFMFHRLFRSLVTFILILFFNKPDVKAADADASQCNCTNRQIPPI